MKRAFLFTVVLLIGVCFFPSSQSHAVIVAAAIKLILSIEDGDMQQAAVTQVKFKGEEVDISKKSFMHRKVTKTFNLAAGQYEIEWTTEKSEKPWGGLKEVKKHCRMIVLELSDAVVYVNVRGDTLTTY